MIEIKSVTKRYGKKQHEFIALDNVSFSIPKGASVAIVGKSGSGKSTLMHIVSGLDRPQEGEVIIDDENILAMNAKQIDRFRAQKIGFIFQSFFLQPTETVADNVGLPLEIAQVARAERKKRVDRALKSVGILDKITNRAQDLSGGQKQRLVIARAIVNEPQIIFADEPTGNLDSVTGGKIEELLFDYNKKKGVTLIIVTHDEDLALKCDIRIRIKDGKIEGIDKKTQKAARSSKGVKK